MLSINIAGFSFDLPISFIYTLFHKDLVGLGGNCQDTKGGRNPAWLFIGILVFCYASGFQIIFPGSVSPL